MASFRHDRSEKPNWWLEAGEGHRPNAKATSSGDVLHMGATSFRLDDVEGYSVDCAPVRWLSNLAILAGGLLLLALLITVGVASADWTPRLLLPGAVLAVLACGLLAESYFESRRLERTVTVRIAGGSRVSFPVRDAIEARCLLSLFETQRRARPRPRGLRVVANAA